MAERKLEGTVVFSALGTMLYGFDVFTVDIPLNLSAETPLNSMTLNERRLTDGRSINYNAQFVGISDAKLAVSGNAFPNAYERSEHITDFESEEETLVYVSERSGNARIHFSSANGRREKISLGSLMGTLSPSEHPGFFFDRPILKNGKAYFVSSQEPANKQVKSWSAVYSTCLQSGLTIRLSPPGVVDYSPGISPSGKWMMVASYGSRDWEGQIEDLHTDLYVFKAEDGSARIMVSERGGWPTWADESTVYFHKRAEDGWWSIYRLKLPSDLRNLQEPLQAERITPPSLHAFTPCASLTGDWIAVATRRPGSKFRHIEIFDLGSKSFIAVTSSINPEIHHYNPFVSSNSKRVGYHRFRGDVSDDDKATKVVPYLEAVESPIPRLKMVRINGFFPAFSPDGSLIAFNPSFGRQDGGVHIVKEDGSKRWKIFKGPAFAIAWNGKQQGLFYASVGPIFASDKATVHIISILFDPQDLIEQEEELKTCQVRILTKEGTDNNAFPSSSPDGKQLVFRSGRSGHKNLYIMDAERGEEGGIRALTEGAWIDTMPSWSPDGEWIAFSSNRHHDPSSNAHFSLYLIRPDGTGLHRVGGGQHSTKERINHVCFSPDSKSVMFGGNLSGVSAEPISVPNQFQPFGELYVCRIDGSEMHRLTFNAYEDGTPAWHKGTSGVDGLIGREKIAGEKLEGRFDEPLWLATPS
eukprot:Gb_15674 [translate_table: standard]